MAKSFGLPDDDANEIVQQMYLRITNYVSDPKKIIYKGPNTDISAYKELISRVKKGNMAPQAKGHKADSNIQPTSVPAIELKQVHSSIKVEASHQGIIQGMTQP